LGRLNRVRTRLGSRSAGGHSDPLCLAARVGTGDPNGQDARVVTGGDRFDGDVGRQCERTVERAVPHLPQCAHHQPAALDLDRDAQREAKLEPQWLNSRPEVT
jgi:hypothetical protein